jgi:hypothetical protein
MHKITNCIYKLHEIIAIVTCVTSLTGIVSSLCNMEVAVFFLVRHLVVGCVQVASCASKYNQMIVKRISTFLSEEQLSTNCTYLVFSKNHNDSIMQFGT